MTALEALLHFLEEKEFTTVDTRTRKDWTEMRQSVTTRFSKTLDRLSEEEKEGLCTDCGKKQVNCICDICD